MLRQQQPQPEGPSARLVRKLPAPFLKWVGGKRQLIPAMEVMLPERFSRYFEPFVGGGALFFHLKPRFAVLADINHELVDCYRAVRDCVDEVLQDLRQHRHDEDYYYAVREQRPQDLELHRRASRTIFLNRTGFNGLYRVNRSGKFNVPFGRYSNPVLCDEDNLRACSQQLGAAHIDTLPFDEVEEMAGPGDLVYFDPPYVPASATANFTAYAADGFHLRDQERLAEMVKRMGGRGVNVMVSNSDTPLTRELYEGLHLHRVMARRNINSDTKGRGAVPELLATTYRPPALGPGVELVHAPVTQVAMAS